MQTVARAALFTALAAVSAAGGTLTGCGGPRSAVRPTAAPPPPPPPHAAPRDPLAADALLADARWLADPARGGRGSLTDDARRVAGWLVDALRAEGLDVVTQPIPTAPGQVNVVAIYRGRHASTPALLITAHYDHLGVIGGDLHPGADDNASGVAVALGVARAVARAGTTARPIVFVFTGAEELGLFGSRAYAADPVWPLVSTRAVINLDMVGRRFFEQVVDRDRAIGAVGLGDDPALAAAAERAAATAGLALVRTSPALLVAIGQGFRGDDWSFRRPGLPAVHFSTGLSDDYHAPRDTADRLVPAQLARTGALVRALIAELDVEVAAGRR